MMTAGPVTAAAGQRPGIPPRVRAATWLLRAVAVVAVSVIALQARSGHRGVVLAALVASAVCFAGWAGIDLAAWRGRQVPALVLLLVLAAIGAAGGILTAIPGADTAVAFAVLAALGAGSELPIAQACAVVVTSVLAIEVSSLVFGFDNGDVGWPLAVVAGALAGRQLHNARVQSAQAIALIAQTERTRAQEQRAATLDERTRIAREIHDLLAHSLGALGIQIEAAQSLLLDTGDIDRAVPLLDHARRLAASGLEETRRAVDALRIDTPPLPDSLTSLAEGHVLQHHTPVEITVTGAARPLSPDANLALIRTAHEALANAAKHAPAAPIAISLDYGPGQTTVTVTNEPSADSQAPGTSAAGMPATAAQGAGGGYGLAGMRERLLLIGGTLTAGHSDPGWTVRAQVPL
jgi:signal transduction histidine kinase